MIIQFDTNSASFQKVFIVSALVTSFACFTLAFSWTGPSGSPPNSNVSAPVNVGTASQVKNGALSVNGLSVYGSQYVQTSLGIGTVAPDGWTLYSVGNTYTSGQNRADGGFCIGGSCVTSFGATAQTYASGSCTAAASGGTCTAYASCPSGYVRSGCSVKGHWGLHSDSYPYSTGSCACQVLNVGGSSQSITCYSYCVK